MQQNDHAYAGFWLRTWATAIDLALLMAVTLPALIAIYGPDYFDIVETGFVAGPADFFLSWVMPALATVAFWITRGATPGKLLLNLRIVDAGSGLPPTAAQCVGRYFAYVISLLPFGLGLLWIAFDARKQGWHDRLANTVVLRRAGATDVSVRPAGH